MIWAIAVAAVAVVLAAVVSRRVYRIRHQPVFRPYRPDAAAARWGNLVRPEWDPEATDVLPVIDVDGGEQGPRR